MGGDLSTLSTNTLTLASGSLAMNNHDITTGQFISASSNKRSLNMGSGTFTLT